MANWLDKYEQGGMVLKKKTKDNYGKKANPNDVKASVGPDFVGLGYNTKGRDYSPAWGGQFAMGGALPGAVGFTYARTAGSAPANGKYTKKTLASAQDGKKVNPNEKKYQAPDKKQIEDWFSNYYASPFFKENLYDKGNAYLPDEGEAVGNATREHIKNLKYTFDDVMSNGYPKLTGLDDDRSINMGDPNNYGNQSRNIALAHEVGHINQNDILAHQPRNVAIMLNRNQVMNRKHEADYMYKKATEMQPRYSDGTLMVPARPSVGLHRLGELKDWTRNESHKSTKGYHDDLVPELRADIMALRYEAANKGIWDATKNKPGSFTPEMLSKLYQSKELNTPVKSGEWITEPQPKSLKPNDLKNVAPPKKPGMILDRLRSRFNDSDLLYLMNKLAKNEGEAPTDKAQNGKEMKFYQEGLDFTPKSISKNGSVIKDDRGQWAYPGEVTEIGSNNITMQGVDYPVLGVSDTGDTQMMQPNQDYKFDGEKVTEYPMMQEGGWLEKFSTIINDQVPSTASVKKKTIDDITTKQQIASQKIIDNQGSIEKAGPKQSAASKTWSILTNPMTALSYKVKGKDLPDHFEKGPRNVLDYAVDMVNPYGVADAASNIPGNLARGEFVEAGLNTLVAFPALHATGVIGKGIKTAGQLSKAKNLKEAAAYTIKGIPIEKSLPRLAEGEVKTFRQIQEIPKMIQAGKSRAEQMKYAIDNNIPDTHFERIFKMPKKDAQDIINSGFGERPAVDREALRNRFRELDAQPTVPETVVANPSINARERWIGEITELTTEPYFGRRIEPAPDFYESLGHRTTPTSYDQMTDSEIEALRNHVNDRYISARRERIANENNMLGDDLDIDREFIDMVPLDRDGTPITNPYYNEFIPEQGTSVPQGLINSLRNSARNNFIRSGRSAGDKLTKAEIKTRGKLENFIENATQNYPYYSGEIEERVPSLFRSHEKSLNDISRKVAKQTENIPSGTVYTGSLNTSHNSWSTQLKQIFNYKGGTPQFAGYKPMNSLGYLSRAEVPEEDIIKYLNTEMDELVKRGKLPKDVQRPFMYKGHPVLPQYAIKQNKNGGWLNKYK